jgi:hypothetical protein
MTGFTLPNPAWANRLGALSMPAWEQLAGSRRGDGADEMTITAPCLARIECKSSER